MIKIEAETKQLEKAIQNVINGLDFKVVNEKGKSLLIEEAKRNFDLQGALYQGQGFVRTGGAFANGGDARTRSRAWSPLTEGTKKDRARKGYPPARPILVRTGRLKGSFDGKAKSTEFEVYNKDKKGAFHQFGTKKMPLRKILDVTVKFLTAYTQLVVNKINEQIKRNGLHS